MQAGLRPPAQAALDFDLRLRRAVDAGGAASVDRPTHACRRASTGPRGTPSASRPASGPRSDSDCRVTISVAPAAPGLAMGRFETADLKSCVLLQRCRHTSMLVAAGGTWPGHACLTAFAEGGPAAETQC